MPGFGAGHPWFQQKIWMAGSNPAITIFVLPASAERVDAVTQFEQSGAVHERKPDHEADQDSHINTILYAHIGVVHQLENQADDGDGNAQISDHSNMGFVFNRFELHGGPRPLDGRRI